MKRERKFLSVYYGEDWFLVLCSVIQTITGLLISTAVKIFRIKFQNSLEDGGRADIFEAHLCFQLYSRIFCKPTLQVLLLKIMFYLLIALTVRHIFENGVFLLL